MGLPGIREEEFRFEREKDAEEEMPEEDEAKRRSRSAAAFCSTVKEGQSVRNTWLEGGSGGVLGLRRSL